MVQSANSICPLLSIGRAFQENCKREKCAWWHTYNRPGTQLPGRCALASIADALTDMDLLGVEINGN